MHYIQYMLFHVFLLGLAVESTFTITASSLVQGMAKEAVTPRQ